MTNTPENIVDLIEDIFERRGAESYLGEEVTMAQHMLQAAQCAEEAGADNSQIVAALLHDIGHYKNGKFLSHHYLKVLIIFMRKQAQTFLKIIFLHQSLSQFVSMSLQSDIFAQFNLIILNVFHQPQSTP